MQARQVAYHTFIQIFGKILGFFISGALLVAVASQLGTDGMGYYVTIVAFVGFFVSISDLGANLIMVREISQNRADRERITGEFLGFRLTYSLITMALAPIAALFIPQYGELIVKGSIIIVAAQILLLVNQMFISMLQTEMMLDRGVLAELANRVTNLVIVLWAIHIGTTGTAFFYLVLYAILIGSFVNITITYSFARRLWPIRPRLSLPSWQRTLITIAPIGLFSFLGMIHFKADTILLSLLKSPTDVGIYGYAYKIGEIIFTFPIMFIGVLFPRLSQLFLTDRDKFKRLSQLTFDALLVGTLPFLTLIFLCAKYLTVILSRASLQDGLLAGSSLQILSLAMVAWFIGSLFIHILIMANDYRGLIRNLLIAVVINLVLNLILIPHFSYYGAAVATVVTEAIMLALTVGYTKRAIDFSPQLTFLPVTLVATTIMAFAVNALITSFGLNYANFALASRWLQMGTVLGIGLAGLVIYLAIFWPLAGRRLLQDLRSRTAD